MDKYIIDISEQKSFMLSKTVTNTVNQRSEAVHEIISSKPTFVEKWGLLICLGILVLLLSGTWFVKYPDIINTRGKLTAVNAPKEIIVRQEGRLVKLFVSNNQKVKRNEIIGWIESTAKHKDVLALSAQLDSSITWLNLGQTEKISQLFNNHYSNLGEIQESYRLFVVAWQQFRDYQVDGFYVKKRSLLIEETHYLESIGKTIEHQNELTAQDLSLAEETFKMNKILLEEDVLSKEQFRLEKSKYVNKEMAVPQQQANLLSNRSQQREKIREIQQLDHDMEQQKIIFQQALHSLRSAIDDWMKKYVLQSPIDGKVVFIVSLQENQFLPTGRILGYINPDETRYYVETNLVQYNFGKIDTGLKVQLRFDAYPYEEAGFVEGTLSYVSSIPSDSGFWATVRLDRGLVTNNHKEIPYKNGLNLQALIVTKNMRLFDRMYYNIVRSTSYGNK